MNISDEYTDRVMTNFSNNLKYRMEINHVTQKELSAKCGVSQQSISKYLTKLSIPRPNVVKSLADALNCTYGDLVDDQVGSDPEYYYSKKTEQMAQQLFENRELRMLFDAAKDVDAETIQKLHEILLLMKKK